MRTSKTSPPKRCHFTQIMFNVSSHFQQVMSKTPPQKRYHFMQIMFNASSHFQKKNQDTYCKRDVILCRLCLMFHHIFIFKITKILNNKWKMILHFRKHSIFSTTYMKIFNPSVPKDKVVWFVVYLLERVSKRI